MNTQVSPVNLW